MNSILRPVNYRPTCPLIHFDFIKHFNSIPFLSGLINSFSTYLPSQHLLSILCVQTLYKRRWQNRKDVYTPITWPLMWVPLGRAILALCRTLSVRRAETAGLSASLKGDTTEHLLENEYLQIRVLRSFKIVSFSPCRFSWPPLCFSKKLLRIMQYPTEGTNNCWIQCCVISQFSVFLVLQVKALVSPTFAPQLQFIGNYLA